MHENFDLDLRISVPEILMNGNVFHILNINGKILLQNNIKLSVDGFGLFLYWTDLEMKTNIIDLSQVSDVTMGSIPKSKEVIQMLLSKFSEEFHDKLFRISYGLECSKTNHLYIIGDDKEISQNWIMELTKITHNIKMKYMSPINNLIKEWSRLRLASNANGEIPAVEIVKTFSLKKPNKNIFRYLSKLELSKNKTDYVSVEDFNFDKFYYIYNKLCVRDDFDRLFKTITKNKCMEPKKFNEFLQSTQGENVTLDESINIIEAIEQTKHLKNKTQLTKDGFGKYLLSDANSALSSHVYTTHMDMTQPMMDYFINTSHNTYLKGDQIADRSSIEMYRQVLLAGCRCIEIDCWDGCRNEPIVTHGKTLCKHVLFKDVLYAIRDTAFVNSEYPLIISIENHCCQSQQFKIAFYLMEILGSYLLKEPMDGFPLDGTNLPSPEQLKRKILIMQKKLPADVEQHALEVFKFHFLERSSTSCEHIHKWMEKSPDIHIHPWLSSLVNYAKSKSISSLEQCDDEHFFIAIDESSAEHLVKQNQEQLGEITRRKVTKVIPSLMRIGSSNMSPQKFWNAGCQMIALNFQISDKPTQLNTYKFEINGNCGYTLKPNILRGDSCSSQPIHFILTIISGQYISDCKVGNYIEITLIGMESDSRKHLKTKMAVSSNYNVVYELGRFDFGMIQVPEMATLKLVAYTKDDQFLGQRLLPVNELKSGYRHITLCNYNNFSMKFSTLFCHIQIENT